jgi:hypothetical protein
MAVRKIGFFSAMILFAVQIASTLSKTIQEETMPPSGCTCPESTAGEHFIRTYCGHEMKQNCSGHVVYSCTGKNITVHLDCPHYTTVVVPQLKYAHYCGISPYNGLARQCAFISDCTEALGLCGFPNLQAVKEEIRKLPREVDRRVHCNRLHNPQNCKFS